MTGGATNADDELVADMFRQAFRFVTDGVRAAVERATAVAGDRRVAVSGGASIVQQVIDADLLDELHLHVSPVLLGGGTRLLDGGRQRIVELDPIRVLASHGVTHLSFGFRTTGGTR